MCMLALLFDSFVIAEEVYRKLGEFLEESENVLYNGPKGQMLPT